VAGFLTIQAEAGPIGHRHLDPEMNKLYDAATLVINYVNAQIESGWLTHDFLEVRRPLEGVQRSLSPGNSRLSSKAALWTLTAIIIWPVVAGVVEECGKRPGYTRNSLAVAVVVDLLIRMGYPNPTVAAVAQVLEKARVADGYSEAI
jgi:hypothetical protein